MDVAPELVVLGMELAKVTGRMSVEAIFDKINSAKQKGNKQEVISNLEQIINELISDKNSLIQISQAYEEKLITQKITEKEIDYITDSIIPLLEELIRQGGSDKDGKVQGNIESIKSILSKETLNIMQILGFNFKKAIGEPLTELVSSLIQSKVMNTSNEMQLLSQQRELEYLKVCQDEEAYQRLIDIMGK